MRLHCIVNFEMGYTNGLPSVKVPRKKFHGMPEAWRKRGSNPLVNAAVKRNPIQKRLRGRNVGAKRDRGKEEFPHTGLEK